VGLHYIGFPESCLGNKRLGVSQGAKIVKKALPVTNFG